VRIALLGGTGFIGSRVARELVSAGHTVLVVHRGRRPAPARCASSVTDRADGSGLARALAEFETQTLLDMIAYTERDVEQVLPALPAGLRRIVVISSGDVYQTYGAFLGLEPPDSVAESTGEEAPLRSSRYPYRATARSRDDMLFDYDKVLVESRYREAPTPVTTLRLPMVYGPGDPNARVATERRRLRSAVGGVLELNPGEAAWRCTRGYVDDVARAVALATTQRAASGRTYNVGETDALATADWLAEIARATGEPIAIRTSPEVAPSRRGEWTVSLVADTGRIRRELSFVEPVGRRAGLLRTLAHSG